MESCLYPSRPFLVFIDLAKDVSGKESINKFIISFCIDSSTSPLAKVLSTSDTNELGGAFSLKFLAFKSPSVIFIVLGSTPKIFISATAFSRSFLLSNISTT